MKRQLDARAFALSLLLASYSAGSVFIVSIVSDFPRVWPGTVFAFLSAGAGTYLFLTKRTPP